MLKLIASRYTMAIPAAPGAEMDVTPFLGGNLSTMIAMMSMKLPCRVVSICIGTGKDSLGESTEDIP